LKTTKVAHIFGYSFRQSKFWQKTDWATFWTIFSQTHLVNLVKTMFVEKSFVEMAFVTTAFVETSFLKHRC
jgi:hypothetical protein